MPIPPRIGPQAYIFNQPPLDCYGFAPGAAYFSSRPHTCSVFRAARFGP